MGLKDTASQELALRQEHSDEGLHRIAQMLKAVPVDDVESERANGVEDHHQRTRTAAMDGHRAQREQAPRRSRRPRRTGP